MTDQFKWEDQPDYDNWPTDPYFAAKQDRYDRMTRELEDQGSLSIDDTRYLIEKYQQFWSLFNFMANKRVHYETELACKQFEIDHLKERLAG